MQGNIIPIHSVLRKKATKLNSQPTQYKKLKLIKIILKINKKNHKKTMYENTIAIHSVLKKKITKLNS